MEAVVAESGEDAVHRLVHSLQAHGALWQLGQLHHRQTGTLRRTWGGVENAKHAESQWSSQTKTGGVKITGSLPVRR